MNTKCTNLCVLPWIHLHVMPNGNVNPCCISPYENSFGNVSKDNILEILNNDKFKKIRDNMIEGKMVPDCARCITLENTGIKSLRQFSNEAFSEHYEKIISSPKNTISFEDIKYVDIRFSNLCNFKCRGCSPALSSSWTDDYQKLYDSELNLKVINVPSTTNDFQSDLQKILPHTEEIYWGGGEPLITKEHFDLLKVLEDKKCFNVRLKYNTNLSQLNYASVDLLSIWSKFKYVELSISIDDIEKRAEYFRHGTKWPNILNNLLTISEKYSGNIFYNINFTVSVFNIFYLPEILNYLLDKKILNPSTIHYSTHYNMMLTPNEYSIQVLPRELKKTINEKFEEFLKKLILNFQYNHELAEKLMKVIEFMNEKDSYDSHIFQFRKQTAKLDQIRGENFKETYPEIYPYLF